MNGILRCHPGIGPATRGIALVAADDFSARYDLDWLKGVFSRPGHKLFGQAYHGRILVLNNAKGGVASAWMLREMRPAASSLPHCCSIASIRSLLRAQHSPASHCLTDLKPT